MEGAPEAIGGTYYYQNCVKLDINAPNTPYSVLRDNKIKLLIKRYNL